MSSKVICRTCLSDTNRMHDLKNTELQVLFEKLTNIKLGTEGGRSAICYICYSQLQRCQRFLVMSRKADKVFKLVLSKGLELPNSITTLRANSNFIMTPVNCMILPERAVNTLVAVKIEPEDIKEEVEEPDSSVFMEPVKIEESTMADDFIKNICQHEALVDTQVLDIHSYKCTLCDETYEEENALETHMTDAHNRKCTFNLKMEQLKKKRGENWSSEEKDILRQLIAESAKILEDKSTKTNTNMLKIREWKNVTNKLNEITGKNRSYAEIKLAWKRMKLAAKTNISLHRREQSLTGGGNKPPSPSPEGLEVMAIAPHDFVVDVNEYDSDGMITKLNTTTVKNPNAGHSSTDPFVVIISDANVESSIKDKQEINTSEAVEIKSSVEIENKPKNKTKRKTAFLNRNQEGRQDIINSNIDFKKKQLEMLEVEHSYQVEISKLKIKKLQLQICSTIGASDKNYY